MTAEGNDDVPLRLGRPPTRQAAPDLSHHGQFKQAAAGGTQQTARRK
jgi:hypothetical protein